MPMVRPRLRTGKGRLVPRSVKFCSHFTVVVEKRGARRKCLSGFRSALQRRQNLARGQHDSDYNTAVSYVIRDFEPGDFDTLWRMDQECFPPGISYSKRELKAYLGYPGAFTLVAVDALSSESQGFIVAQGGST